MTSARRIPVTILAGALLAGVLAAQMPQLNSIRPRGGQRGTEVELTLRGNSLAGAQDLLFEREGLAVVSLEQKEKKDKLVATIAIAPDAPLGPHAVWVRTPTGLSNLQTLHVGALAEVDESEPNGSSDEAQAIELDTTVNGVADNEDVDVYAFQGAAGERVSVEIEGLRLGDVNFDPAVNLLDDRGFPLASCDDSALGRRDPALTVTLPADGRYLIQVRESAYRGNGNCRYRLHVGRFARPLAVLPLGGAPGEEVELRMLGADGVLGETAITLPPSRAHGGWTPAGVAAVHLADAGGIAPTPTFLRISDLPRAAEVEPNQGDEAATPVTVPAALEGVLETEGDYDWFRFSGKKGQTLVARAWGRRLRSPIDPFVVARQVGGKDLQNNDDDGGPDSRIRFTLPADGDYTVRLRDHLFRGGPEFAYRLEVTPDQSSLSLSIPIDRKQVAIPRGGRTDLFLSVERERAGGPLALSFDGLPAGVTARTERIPAGEDQVLVVLEAAADAPAGQALADVQATQEEGEGISGGLREEITLVEGRNQTILWAHSLDRLPVAVCEPAPFTIRLEDPGVPLVRNGRLDLTVTVERNEGFDGAVTLYLPLIPGGTSTVQARVIEAGQTSAPLELHGGGNARLGDWPLVIAAEADVDGSRVRVCTEPVVIDVQRPIVTFAAQAVDVERGDSAEMFVEVKRPEWYRGAATVTLVGLPHGVTSEPRELDGESESLSFPITTTGDSPVGKHKGLSFQARFRLEGGEIVQGLSAAQLRIQKPAPSVAKAKPKPKPKPVEAAAPAQKKEKPPTRLEKLRATHAEQLKALEEESTPAPEEAGAEAVGAGEAGS